MIGAMGVFGVKGVNDAADGLRVDLEVFKAAIRGTDGNGTDGNGMDGRPIEVGWEGVGIGNH